MLSLPGVWVQSLVRVLRFYKPRSTVKQSPPAPDKTATTKANQAYPYCDRMQKCISQTTSHRFAAPAVLLANLGRSSFDAPSGFSGIRLGFPGSSEVKASACSAGDLGLIPRLRRSPGEGNGNPLQYSCLENPMDRGAWQTIVHEVTKESDMI